MHAKFRYSLGAAVILVTSAPFVLEDLRADHDENNRSQQDEGDEFASLESLRIGLVEEGKIIGRSEFLKDGQPVEGQYLVRYRAGDGRQVEEWFVPDALTTGEAIKAGFEAEIAAAEAMEPVQAPEAPLVDPPIQQADAERPAGQAPEGC